MWKGQISALTEFVSNYPAGNGPDCQAASGTQKQAAGAPFLALVLGRGGGWCVLLRMRRRAVSSRGWGRAMLAGSILIRRSAVSGRWLGRAMRPVLLRILRSTVSGRGRGRAMLAGGILIRSSAAVCRGLGRAMLPGGIRGR
jgi:hypothetical protein